MPGVHTALFRKASWLPYRHWPSMLEFLCEELASLPIQFLPNYSFSAMAGGVAKPCPRPAIVLFNQGDKKRCPSLAGSCHICCERLNDYTSSKEAAV